MCYIPWYIACYITCFLQAGLLDPPDAEAANMLTASDRLIQEHVRKYKNGAAELQDLIQQVLHHPDFNPQQVDHDMHELYSIKFVLYS